ncbi:MAG: hypothetical protein IJW20_07790 [Clostridia bacterium]|nr:hypothetical protein [Clostridia bacterium]
MEVKDITLTKEQYKRICALDSILLLSCTNEEQADQMMSIIKNRINQKEKLCAQPTTATHSL